MTLSRSLARFTAGLSLDAIAAPVRERACHLALDAIGIALASSRNDFAHTALAGIEALGGGEQVVFGFGPRLALRDAILMNGILVHGLDYDDTYLPGSMHLCATAVPASFGVAAARRAGGRELLAALIVGLEVGARIAQAGKGNIHKAGFHPTGVCGAFASGLVAGRLFGLTEEQLVRTQGISLAIASGTVQPMQDGTWTKRLHPGWAAAGGVTAASLARAGYTGPEAAYEGRYGFYPVFLGPHAAEADPALVTDGLGERWEFTRASIKLYPACHHMHAFVNAARELRAQHRFDVDDITDIEARVAEIAVPLVCEPPLEKCNPATSYIAQFSLQFALACGLTRGRFGLGELEDAALTDPALRALAHKVRYTVDPESGFPKRRSGEIVVTLRDGRVLRYRNNILPDEPESNAAIVTKFIDNARMAVSAAQAQALCARVLDLEREPDAARLMHTLGLVQAAAHATPAA